MVTLNSDRATTLIFGAYELDLQAGVLRKDGIRLRCQEQPLQVLASACGTPGGAGDARRVTTPRVAAGYVCRL